MKKKIFAVSDVHGHYSYLKKALDEAGFEEHNETHVLVVCGDNFDRGEENVAVYDYLKTVPNKVLIRGNHEDILERVLLRDQLGRFDYANGTDKTVVEFFGRLDAYDEEKKEEILSFIRSQRDYFETKNYIFVHGWIPLAFSGGPALLPDFRAASKESWTLSRELSWMECYAAGLTVPGKTIVCGHRASCLAYRFDKNRYYDDYSVFEAEGVVAIDPCAVRSGIVNVFCVEDDLLDT